MWPHPKKCSTQRASSTKVLKKSIEQISRNRQIKFLTGFLTGKSALLKNFGWAKKTSDLLLHDEKIIFDIRAIGREHCAAQVRQSLGPPILKMTFPFFRDFWWVGAKSHIWDIRLKRTILYFSDINALIPADKAWNQNSNPNSFQWPFLYFFGFR